MMANWMIAVTAVTVTGSSTTSTCPSPISPWQSLRSSRWPLITADPRSVVMTMPISSVLICSDCPNKTRSRKMEYVDKMPPLIGWISRCALCSNRLEQSPDHMTCHMTAVSWTQREKVSWFEWCEQTLYRCICVVCFLYISDFRCVWNTN